ncbi:pyridoxal 5'-phosphate synthase, synthase subunit Pdx1 [Geoglobus ahangari]|uniref:Pyridoxal 5'-phosphate synthase subunit PdxS n=1 Tax=Geoglobus ahangari TaxID=113653 RepID=A0A0F7IHW3_9EURY|nr:pyridoxal 5'-phosphate synthase lyase subunit PdxS [Geoglobus ahangari]AKG92598.1 pyridoxal 5'-phosphate synthase, synthase subunit Pdx1 [Geoglobus ahangari]NOY10941.1 pyridoxal 5'-phosphate synthase lyase subunit PdxS [Archaeoglobi archaeon]
MELEKLRFGTELVKRGFAKMQKGGVIMDVTTPEQAAIAEEAGAVAVMALHKVPADIRASGGVARMADPRIIQEIMDAVTIPVMAKVRIGHYAEARALEAIGVDMIDESEVLTPADPFYHIDKRKFTVPFVCGARSLGEAVRRIWEGAAMIRTKGEAGTGNVVEAVRHMRMMNYAIERVRGMDDYSLYNLAETYARAYLRLPEKIHSEFSLTSEIRKDEVVYEEYTFGEVVEGLFEVLTEVRKMGRLPVVNFAAGGVATPADAAFMMQLGADGVFVGSGIFKSSNPQAYARAIVQAVEHYDEPEVIAEVSKGLGEPMKGLDVSDLEIQMQERGV